MNDAAGQAYGRKAAVVASLFFLCKCVLASVFELSNDESYYWLYSQHIKLNYFDHPPMVALWIRLSSFNLWLDDYPLFLRLGSLLSCGLASFFIYKTCTRLYAPKAGFYAVCLYNASFYTGIISGMFCMPDAPQMVFWTLALWMLVLINENERSWTGWLLFGISAGLCFMSKIHGVFLWTGLGAFILMQKRNWLRLPQLYTALLISLIITSPILIWNIQNDFVTYRFHSERVTVHRLTLNGSAFLEEVLSQLFFNNPVNVLLILAALFCLPRRMPGGAALTLFKFIGIPLALLLLAVALFRDTLPHWSGPAYVALLPLAAVWLATGTKPVFVKLFPYSGLAFLLFIVAWPLLLHLYPGTFGSKEKAYLGKGDITIDMYGWQQAGLQFDSLYQADLSRRYIPAGTPVVCNKWWGAHQEYYFCEPSDIQMMGLGATNDLHEYEWRNAVRKERVNMNQAYCIVPSEDNYNVKRYYAPYYDTIIQDDIFPVIRGGRPAHYFTVYNLRGWKGRLPVR